MWFMTKFGIMSVTVIKPSYTDLLEKYELQVRTRDRSTLIELRKVMGANLTDTVASTNSDYPYRAFCTKDAFAAAMTTLIHGINAGNFKGSVKNKRLKNLYMRIWSTYAMTYQELRPRTRRKR